MSTAAPDTAMILMNRSISAITKQQEQVVQKGNRQVQSDVESLKVHSKSAILHATTFMHKQTDSHVRNCVLVLFMAGHMYICTKSTTKQESTPEQLGQGT